MECTQCVRMHQLCNPAQLIYLVVYSAGWVKTDMTNNSGLIDAKTSVAGLISVLESDKPLSCHWYDYKHEEIPW